MCCLLNLARPVFEVSGNVVGMATEMALAGVKGVLHITRSVYELIYGGKYQIRERGEVQLMKFGKVVTYILAK